MEVLVISNHQLGPKTVTWAFDHTPTGSLLRQMIVSFAATRWDRATFVSNKAHYHPEFVLDLAEYLMHQTGKQRIEPRYFVNKLSEFLEDEPSA